MFRNNEEILLGEIKKIIGLYVLYGGETERLRQSSYIARGVLFNLESKEPQSGAGLSGEKSY